MYNRDFVFIALVLVMLMVKKASKEGILGRYNELEKTMLTKA